MAQHYPEIIGIAFLLVFAATMFYQGTCILRGQRGLFFERLSQAG